MSFDDDYNVGAEDLGKFVPVIYAKSSAEAERYRQLLEDHDIPALVDEDYEPDEPGTRRRLADGVPVLVPESLLEDSREFFAEVEELQALDAHEEDKEEDEDDEVYYDDEEEQDEDLEDDDEEDDDLDEDEKDEDDLDVDLEEEEEEEEEQAY